MTLILALTAAIYWPTLHWLVQKWVHNPMYSHGFLVPCISVWLLWRSRINIKKAVGPAGRGGLLLILAALVIQGACTSADIKTVGAYSLIFLLWSIFYWLWGSCVARITTFPIAFLFFMIPLYDAVTDLVSLHLKLLVAKLAVWLLDATRLLVAVREGVMIHLPAGSIEVADPCSGIRSLVALTALAVLLGYLHRGKLWERMVIALAAAPIAVATNLIRVVALCLMMSIWGAAVPESRYVHTLTGILVYVVALMGLLLLGRILPGGQLREKISQKSQAALASPGKDALSPSGQCIKLNMRRYFFLVGMLGVSALANIGYRNFHHGWTDLPELYAFPNYVGEWKYAADVMMDPRIIEIVGADGIVFREYKDAKNDSALLCMMYHLNDRYGAHSPEVCYTSQGWSIILQGSEYTKRVMLPDSGLEVNEFVVKKGEQEQIVLYWFFGSGKRQTASRAYQMVANAVHSLTHPISISGFVRVSSSFSPNTEDIAKKKVREFADQVAIAIRPYLP